MTADEAVRALGYVRISKADRGKSEADQRHSINAQREAITETAEAKGWELLHIYEDFSVTGAHLNRKDLQEALDLLKAGDANMLCVARFDRLSRSARDWLDLLFDSSEQGWSISVLSEEIDTTTATGWMRAAIRAVFAEYERRLIGERTKAALAVVAKVKHVGRRSMIKPKVRRRIVAMHEEGMSASAIARVLTADGVAVDEAKGRTRWHHSVVRACLVREGVAS